MNIATALNKKYLYYTGVMLTSLCVNNGEHIDAYLLHSELEEEDIRILEDSLKQYDISIISLKVDGSKFDVKLPRNTQWSIETYYRLMLMDILPESVERLLYLDVDLIINQSICDLYHMDFGEYEIIAADDSNGKRTPDTFGEKQREMFGPMLQQGYRYFNAGVMLLNIGKIRQNHNFRTYMEAVEEWNYQMEAPDQDILNYVHWERIGYVDYAKYDLFARISHNQKLSYQYVKENTAIIHYAGDKPWDVQNCHFDIEQIWWDYAKMTPFYHRMLEEMQYKLMMDGSLETFISGLLAENGELKSKVQQLIAINDKLMMILQGPKN